MRHRKTKKTLDRKKASREAMLKNLAASVIIYERVKTTKARAKVVRPIVEKLITTGKVNTLQARRKLLNYLPLKNAVNKVLEELGPKYRERKGGYTRIVDLGRRQGDGAEMAQIELV